MPAGTYMSCENGQRGGSRNDLTIIPNVHAVRMILIKAVSTRRKTFSLVAVGLALGSTGSVDRKIDRILLAQAVIVPLRWATLLEKVGHQFRGLHTMNDLKIGHVESKVDAYRAKTTLWGTGHQNRHERRNRGEHTR